ncbi:hypothetical protein GCM10010191_01390 [Actinomadura vinacea]|uniref:Uncharacterized protein n=1 Tax=Actinomadura vinacea TaxID=115336 RepID=A0ABP5VB38_9ACTN
MRMSVPKDQSAEKTAADAVNVAKAINKPVELIDKGEVVYGVTPASDPATVAEVVQRSL